MLKKNNFICSRKGMLILVIGMSALLGVLIVITILLSNRDGPPGSVSSEPTHFLQASQPDAPSGWTDPVAGETEPTKTGASMTDPTDYTELDDPIQSGTDDVIPTEPEPTNPSPPGQLEEPPNPHTPTEPEIEKITCDSFAIFSGAFVEDGSGILVENVAAILVTNRSDQFLDMATMTFDVDGREAVFLITGLHPGKSAWVMEKNGMTIPAEAVFTYVDGIHAFRDDVITDTKDLTIQSDGNSLTAVNNTNRVLDNVAVYYKTLHTDGNYFGGITYLVSFGTLAPGEAVEKLAGHFDAATSEIVRISWQERQTQ